MSFEIPPKKLQVNSNIQPGPSEPPSSRLPLPTRAPLIVSGKTFKFIKLSDAIRELKDLSNPLLNLAGKVSLYIQAKGSQLLNSLQKPSLKSEIPSPQSTTKASTGKTAIDTAPIYKEISETHSHFVAKLQEYIELKPWESLAEVISPEEAWILKEGRQELHAFESEWAEKFLALKDPNVPSAEKAKIFKGYTAPENMKRLVDLYAKVNSNVEKGRVIFADLKDTLLIAGEEAAKKDKGLTPKEEIAKDYYLAKTNRNANPTPLTKTLMADFNSLLIVTVQRPPRLALFSGELTKSGVGSKSDTQTLNENIKKLNSLQPKMETSNREELMQLSKWLSGSNEALKVLHKDGHWVIEERSTLISFIPLIGSSRVGKSQDAVNTFKRLYELSLVNSDKKIFNAVYKKFSRTEWFQEAKNNNPQLQAIDSLIQGSLKDDGDAVFRRIISTIKEVKNQKLFLNEKGVPVFTDRKAGLAFRKGGENSQAALIALLGLAKPLYEKNKSGLFNRNADLQLRELQGFLQNNDWASKTYGNLSPELKEAMSFLEEYGKEKEEMKNTIAHDLKKLPDAAPSERKMILHQLLFSDKLSAVIQDNEDLKSEYKSALEIYMSLKKEELAGHFLVENPHDPSKQAFLDGYRKYMTTDELFEQLNKLLEERPHAGAEIRKIVKTWFKENPNEHVKAPGAFGYLASNQAANMAQKAPPASTPPRQEAIDTLKAQLELGPTKENRSALMEQWVSGINQQSARLAGKIQMGMLTDPETKLDDPAKPIPLLAEVARNFNNIATFVTSQVLKGDKDQVSDRYKFFIDVAVILYEKGDYSGAHSVYAGLMATDVARLKSTDKKPNLPIKLDAEYTGKDTALNEAFFSATVSPSLKSHMHEKSSFIFSMAPFKTQLIGAFLEKPFKEDGTFNVNSLLKMNSLLSQIHKLPSESHDKQLFEYVLDDYGRRSHDEWSSQFTEISKTILPRSNAAR